MAKPDLDDSAELARGRSTPDLQEDIIDSQQVMGLEAEERALAEENLTEQLDVLEGLRQLQSADPIRWKIYRFGHEESKYNGYLGELPTTALTQETMRRKYGGGNYRVRGFFSTGKYATQRSINIAGESILYVPTEVNGAAKEVQNSNSGFNVAEFMALQNQQAEKQRRTDDERAERRAQENRQFILSIGAVVAPIVTAMVQRTAPAPAATPLLDPTLIALLKPSTESPVSSMKGMLELMTLMKGIVAPESSGSSELAEIINAVTPIAGPALQAFANRPQTAPVQTARLRAQPNPTTVPTPLPGGAPAQRVTIDAVPVQTVPHGMAPARQAVPGEQPTVLQASTSSDTAGVDLSAPSQPMTSEQQSMFAQLKPQVDTLVQLARDGQDAVQVGEMFFDQYLVNADDALYEQLCELFEDAKTIDRIALFNKGVNEFRPWFEGLQAAIVKKIKLEEAQATVQNTAVESNEPG